MPGTDPILSTHLAITPDVAMRLRYMSPVITVIGDPMLDGWWRGTSTKMAREAPAPVVRLAGKQFVPGGAANTAMNVASLGARVRFVGIAGLDESGERLRDLLAVEGIDVTGLILHPDVSTITKDRIVAGDQVLARLDSGQEGDYPLDAVEALAAAAVAATDNADAELICDYATGMLPAVVRDALLARRIRPPLTVIDAHDPTLWKALRPDLVTPNAEETAAMMQTPLPRNSDRPGIVAGLAPGLLEASGAGAAIVTLDRDGTVMFDGQGAWHRTWARPTTDKQASGAGDTFVAAVTVARACGLPLTTSADLAQSAADVVVGRFGTSVCSTADLVSRLAEFADSALDREELLRRLRDERTAGRRIVFTNGCFDVLHRGHTAYLGHAKLLGDVLVVAVNSDESVRRLKGAGRPINSAADRAGVLAALSCVDYVTVFDEDTPIPLIAQIRPEVHAKGGDYRAEDLDETAVVRAYGGEVRILDYLPEHSTTAVVERIRGGRRSGARRTKAAGS